MISLLKELHIENLAVIENAAIELGDKLNVFTGETGAGKSILIGGINAVLGQRIYKDVIRDGASKAYVSAVFTDIPLSAQHKLEQMGFDASSELIISREINQDGKSSARINSRPVNVSSLREIGDLLVNIHGQHDSQVLLDPSKHLEILDEYAQSEKLLSEYKTAFKALQSCAREINRLKQDALKNTSRVEYLSRIIDDISALDIEENEDEYVENRFKVLDNAVSLSEAISLAISGLSGDESSSGAGEIIARAYTELEINEELLPELKPIAQRLSSLGIELDDISNELSGILSGLDIDESEYASLTQRRNELVKIKRRYGPELKDVLKVYYDAIEERDGLIVSDDRISELETKKAQLLSDVTKKAERLSEHRRTAAERFISGVTSELEFLNMPNVRLVVDNKRGKLTSTGLDNVELLISANKGESLKPLAKIASGGELSRIMLALKAVLADRDSIPTLIFDEIDTGVSGRAAQKIGIKLREISRKHQVLCVTHLPQIAIMADDHLLIEKNVCQSRTVTNIMPLGFEERKYEIARMLSGDSITETVLRDAEEQLASAAKL